MIVSLGVALGTADGGGSSVGDDDSTKVGMILGEVLGPVVDGLLLGAFVDGLMLGLMLGVFVDGLVLGAFVVGLVDGDTDGALDGTGVTAGN